MYTSIISNRYIFWVFAVFTLITSCGNNQQKALAFNDKIANISVELERRGRAIGEDLKAAVGTRDFSEVKSKTASLTSYLDESVSNVEGMENVAGSEELKNSMLKFLKYEQSMVKEAFIPFTVMNENTTQEEIQAAAENLMDQTKDESRLLAELRTAQQNFASKNKIVIKEKS